jgi:hypothetical protein
MRADAAAALEERLGTQWRTAFDESRLADEEEACSLALGLSA